MNSTWQNNHHCAVCHLKSHFHYFMFSRSLRVDFHSPSLNWDLLYSVAPSCLSYSWLSRGWFYTLSAFNICQAMIWDWEKPRLQMEDEVQPFDVGRAVLSEGLSPEQRPPARYWAACSFRATGRMRLCLLAPGHIPFCLGLTYTHALLNYLMKIL